jgi:hypothetical protein
MSNDSYQQPPPPRRHEAPLTDDDHREPDELDALLERTAGPNGDEGNNSNAMDDDEESHLSWAGRPSYNSADSASNADPQQPGHRKSHTVATDLFHQTGLDRIGGLFGRNVMKKSRARKRQQHRKNKSSLSDLLVQNLHLEPIVEDFRHMSSSINNIWIEELEDMDRGNGNGFFDMTATRSLVRSTSNPAKENMCVAGSLFD